MAVFQMTWMEISEEHSRVPLECMTSGLTSFSSYWNLHAHPVGLNFQVNSEGLGY